MAVVKRLVKGSALTHAELDGNFSDYETFKALWDITNFTAGNDGKVLYWDNTAGTVEVKTLTTTEITEGTNLYYTDARADARVNNAILDEDNFASDSATKVPSQQSVKAYIATQIATKDNSDEITEGSTNLYFTNARARASISLGSAGSQAYNNSTGVLTIPGTTDHITEGSTNLFYTDARADARAQAKVDAVIDSAPGALDTLNELAAALGDDANFSTTITNSIATKISNVVEDTSPQLGGSLNANGNDIDMGTNIITDAKVGNWDTAHGWGNHASAGYGTLSNVVEDTTPQLGGQLDTNGNDIKIADNDEAKFGNSPDLKISHTNSLSGQDDSNGTSVLDGGDWCSYIYETGTGPLVFKSNGGPGTGAYQFYDAGWRPILRLYSGTSARAGLYYAGAEKLVTTASGVKVTDVLNLNPVAFASLPGSPAKGDVAFLTTDSNSNTKNKPVYYDGTNWKYFNDDTNI